MKNVKIIRLVACLIFCFASSFGFAKGNEKKFCMTVDIDLFQFEGEVLLPYQRVINEDLNELKQSKLEEFKGSLSFFIDNIQHYKKKFDELVIDSKVYKNDGEKFSVIVELYPYNHGASGCQTRLKSFNYKIENGEAKKLSLRDIVKSNGGEILLIKLAVEKVNKEFSDSLYELVPEVEFAFQGDNLIIFFQPYSIACGADGVLSANLAFEEIKNFVK